MQQPPTPIPPARRRRRKRPRRCPSCRRRRATAPSPAGAAAAARPAEPGAARTCPRRGRTSTCPRRRRRAPSRRRRRFLLSAKMATAPRRVFIAILGLVVAACATTPAAITPAAASIARANQPAAFLAAHNRERAAAGVPPLIWDSALAGAGGLMPANWRRRTLFGTRRGRPDPARAKICGWEPAAPSRHRSWSPVGRRKKPVSVQASSPRSAEPAIGRTSAITAR